MGFGSAVGSGFGPGLVFRFGLLGSLGRSSTLILMSLINLQGSGIGSFLVASFFPLRVLFGWSPLFGLWRRRRRVHYNLDVCYHLAGLAAELLGEVPGIEWARACDRVVLLVVGDGCYFLSFFLLNEIMGGNQTIGTIISS